MQDGRIPARLARQPVGEEDEQPGDDGRLLRSDQGDRQPKASNAIVLFARAQEAVDVCVCLFVTHD